MYNTCIINSHYHITYICSLTRERKFSSRCISTLVPLNPRAMHCDLSTRWGSGGTRENERNNGDSSGGRDQPWVCVTNTAVDGLTGTYTTKQSNSLLKQKDI